VRQRIKSAIKITQSEDYFSFRIKRIEELRKNHEENLEFFKEILSCPVKIKTSSNCIVSILGTLIKVPTEMAEKAKYKILKYI
jgi:hypothetical protein